MRHEYQRCEEIAIHIMNESNLPVVQSPSLSFRRKRINSSLKSSLFHGIFLLSLALFILSSAVFLYNTWNSRKTEFRILDADSETLHTEASIFSWTEVGGTPVSLEKVNNPDKPGDLVLSIQRESGQKWAGVAKPLLFQIPLSMNDTISLDVKNLGPPLLFFLEITEASSSINPNPETWEKEYSLETHEWKTIQIPLYTLYPKPYHRTLGRIGNERLDLNSIAQLDLLFPPDLEINFVLDTIKISTSKNVRFAAFFLFLNLIWWVVLFQYAPRSGLVYMDRDILTESLKFCLYQIAIIFTPYQGEIVWLLNLLLGYSLFESMVHLSHKANLPITRLLVGCSPFLAYALVYRYAPLWPMSPLMIAAHCFPTISYSRNHGLEWSIVIYSLFIIVNHITHGIPFNALSLGGGMCALFGFHFAISAHRKYIQEKEEQLNLQALYERQFLHTQKMEAIGQLTRGMAHEFNNLLTGIIGNLRLIQMRKHPDINHFLDNAVQSADRAADLIQKLQLFGRLSRIQTQPLDLNHLMEETLRLIQQNWNEDIILKTHLAHDIPPIHADPLRMKMVFMNLLINARDAINTAINRHPDRLYSIQVETAVIALDQPPKIVPQFIPGQYAIVTVRDNGIGMDENTLPHIFDPFFTTKQDRENEGGFGLGLACAYGVIKEHRGWLDVESQPNEGATFRVYLPLIEE